MKKLRLCWWGSVEVLSDWKMLTKALLDDKATEQRGDVATTNLALVLRHAAERACSTSASDGRQASPVETCLDWPSACIVKKSQQLCPGLQANV